MSVRNLLLRTALHKNPFINVAPAAIKSKNRRQYGKENDSYTQYKKKNMATILFGSILVGSAVTDQIDKKSINKEVEKDSTPTGNQKSDNVTVEAGVKRPDLPTYRAEEVSKHDNMSSFWVSYKHGVYDVTKFLVSHPGGEQILNAAGLSIEPFWNVYGMHKTQEVFKLLESFRIGNLHDDDVVDHTDDEMWVKEPYRDKRLIVKTAKPFNAEIPPKLQIEYFDTPNELFYVRQHMPVPECDAGTHRLRVVVAGGVTAVHEFTLDDLRRHFPTVGLRAALMCAGNRRSEMNKVKPVKGISWAGGAISNARWAGIPLRPLLIHCGVDPNNTQGKHVIFQGSDIDATGVNFSTSIPLDMAMNPASSILLATHMNGDLLPLDHGYPLRVIVPGAPAVRSVKWLESITVSEDESPSHWHQKDYRAFNPSKTWDTADFATAPPVYSLPVTSAICDPADTELVPVVDGAIKVRGYAYSGGGAKVLRVDVSPDQGKTWIQAEPVAADDAPPQRHYSWTLWVATIPISPGQTEVELWAKATDSNFNTQPEKFDDIWNIRGILSNAYHRITVKLEHTEE